MCCLVHPPLLQTNQVMMVSLWLSVSIKLFGCQYLALPTNRMPVVQLLLHHRGTVLNQLTILEDLCHQLVPVCLAVQSTLSDQWGLVFLAGQCHQSVPVFPEVQSSQWGQSVLGYLGVQCLQWGLGCLADRSTLSDQSVPECLVVQWDLVVRCRQWGQSSLSVRSDQCRLLGRSVQCHQSGQSVLYHQLGQSVQLGQLVLVFLVGLVVRYLQLGLVVQSNQ